MDSNIINDEEKFLAGKLKGYTLKSGENKFDHKGNPLSSNLFSTPFKVYPSSLPAKNFSSSLTMFKSIEVS